MKSLKTVFKKSISGLIMAVLLSSVLGFTTAGAYSMYRSYRPTNALLVYLGADSSSTKYVEAGEDDVKVLSLVFGARSHENINLENITFSVKSNTEIDGFSLVDEDGIVLGVESLTGSQLDFSNLDYVIPAGEKVVLDLYADVSADAVSGQAFIPYVYSAECVEAEGMESGNDLDVIGNFPMVGGMVFVN